MDALQKARNLHQMISRQCESSSEGVSMPFRIRRTESIEDAIRRIACEQVDATIAETGGRGRRREAAVHSARKRCKRIRALLRLVRPQIGDAYDLENGWYRDAARDLAHFRDAQVMIDTFDGLLKHFANAVERQAFAGIRRTLTRQRDAASVGAELRGHLREFRDRMREARTRIDSWPIGDQGFAAIEDGLRRIYARGRRALHAAYEAPSTETIHEWRKRVKDHAHHIELLRSVWKAPMHARRDELDALADHLGDDHDLSVLREHLLTHPCDARHSETLQAVIGLIARRQVELRVYAHAAGARVFAEKPDAFVRRIEVYWHAWRNEPATAAQLGYRPELVTA
jgi:CHAD domain-containing protein